MRLGVTAAVVDGVLLDGDVEIDDGKVVGVGLSGGGSGTALPGFIDIHTHGFGGIDFATASEQELARGSMALAATGVTAYQPTLLTLEVNELVDALGRHHSTSHDGARFLGTHVEGPFLSREHPGAHDPELLLDPDADVATRLIESGSLAQMTLAPELPGAQGLIRLLRDSGVSVALGHSNATAEEARAAIALGGRILTHIFNASRPFAHRDPGIIGVALTDPHIYVTAVVDNVHLSKEATLIAMRSAGDRFVAVTDAMSAAGLGNGVYTLGNRSVEVRAGEARLPDGTIASSVLTMDQALRNLVELGWPLERAAAAVSTNPAAAIEREAMGRIEIGAAADVVVVDENLEVVRTLVGGREVFAR